MARSTTIVLGFSALTILLSLFLPQYLPFSPVTSFVTLTAAAVLATKIYSILLWPYVFSPLRHLPGPTSENWIFGEFPKIARLPSGQPHKDEYIKIPNNGLIRYLGLWNRERLMATNAKTLQQALSTDAHIWLKPPLLRAGLAVVLGRRGLLFAEGDVHRSQRKILTPAFSRRQVRNLVPVFWEKALFLVQKVREERAAGSGLVNISKWTSLATLDIIGAAGLGYDFRAVETGGNDSELARVYNTIFAQTTSANMIRFMGLFVPERIMYYLPFKRSREVRAAHRTLEKVCQELITTKRAAIARGMVKGDEKDILSVLINSGEYDSADGEVVVRDQLMTFLAAGHETTAALTVWAIHLLTLYPQYQTLLREEFRSAFPDGCPEALTYEQLDSLKHLHNFCEEVIRYYPPVALTMRENIRDTTLDGHFVPKGTMLVVVPWALHKDPKVWGEDADEFRPERWEKRGVGMESNYNLLTFLAGPRSCIAGGQGGFAKMEFKALLAALVAQLKFEGVVGKNIEIQGGITSRPKGGLKVKIEEAESW